MLQSSSVPCVVMKYGLPSQRAIRPICQQIGSHGICRWMTSAFRKKPRVRAADFAVNSLSRLRSTTSYRGRSCAPFHSRGASEASLVRIVDIVPAPRERVADVNQRAHATALRKPNSEQVMDDAHQQKIRTTEARRHREET